MAADETSSEEWFARYLAHAGMLALLALVAIGVAWYLDGADYLGPASDGPDAGFLICAVLCPVLGIVAFGLLVYAGIRLLRRPHTLEHVLLRFAFLIAHAGVLAVSLDASATLTSNLLGGVDRWLQQDIGADAMPPWAAVGSADRTGAQYDVREGSPDDHPASPSGMGSGPGGPPTRGR